MGSRGNRGDTQGQPYANEHGRPLTMLYRLVVGMEVGLGVGEVAALA